MNTVPTTNYTTQDTGYSTPCWIWKGYKQNGYPMLPRNKEGTRYAHRWVYESIHGKQPKFPEYHLHHKCEQRSCINPDHITILHQADHRRTYSAKMSITKAREVRELYSTGKWSQKSLAQRYSVSRATIIHILKNRIWRESDWTRKSFQEAKRQDAPDMRHERRYY